MADLKLTQSEADRIIKMLKISLEERIKFPSKGKHEEFKVEGEKKDDIFTIHIRRGNIDGNKYSIHAKISKNNIGLLRLDIGKNLRHRNPNNEIIKGDHWHIYDEKYDLHKAYPAHDIQDSNFVNETINFLDKFSVIEKPRIIYQMQIE